MLTASSVAAELALGSSDPAIAKLVNSWVGKALSGTDASADHGGLDVRAADRRLP